MRRVGTLGLVAALAAILVSPLPAHAEDASGAVTYNAGNGYSFEKLSHPTVGTSQPDGIVDYQGNGAVAVPGADGNTANNEGDRGQSYTWAAASYGDWLYVGTCYAAMGNTLTLMNSTLGDSFDVETMRLTLEAMFNGTFFYGQQKEDGTADKDSGGILVKINTKTGETKLLLSESLNGVAPLFRNAVSYKGKLYFCGSVRTNDGKGGLPAVYEIDPKTDEYKVVYQGLSSMQDYGAAYKQGISTGIRGMCVHDGQLVISNVGKDTNGNFVSTILTSSDPSKGQDSFTEIANSETLFGYPAIRYQDSIYGGAIWDMVSYNGHLYATICPVRPRTLPMIIPCSRLPWSVATRMPTAAIRGLPLSAIRRRTVQSTALASILPVPVLALPTSSSTTTTSISVNTTTRRLPSSASCSTNPTPKRAARAAWVALTARL